jgi:molybdopterin converting factor small subunit
MPITIRLTGPLRPFADGKASLAATAATVGEALGAAVTQHPGLQTRLFDRKGALRSEIRVYVNDDDLRLHQGLETPLAEGDQVTVIAPLAAG